MLTDEQLKRMQQRLDAGSYDSRADLAALLEHVAELTAILDSGQLMYDDCCGGFMESRSECIRPAKATPVLVLELPDGKSGWREAVGSEWPVTDTGSTRTSTLGREAPESPKKPQNAAGESR